MEAEKIIVVHNGALGDFLSAWPAIYALACHYNSCPQSNSCSQKNHNPQTSPKLIFAGKSEWLPWLLPLGFKAATPEIQKTVENLYTASKWPSDLNSSKIFWFCLQAPPLELRHDNLVFLPALDFGSGCGGELYFEENRPPTPALSGVMQNLRFHLRAHLGPALWPVGKQTETGPSWQSAWQALFGGWGKPALGGMSRAGSKSDGPQSVEIALVPGAGHRKKQWPLPCFEEVASALQKRGFSPVFLFGPAEEERGLRLSEEAQAVFRAECPTPAQTLGQRLLQMRLIIACDGGPAHLAAMHGVPGLVLFGPTSPAVWAPPGLKVISPDWNNVEPVLRASYQQPLCDPKEIDPNMASSLDLITPQEVLQVALPLLGLSNAQ